MIKIKTAIIIAGGKSTRLKPLTNNKPKTMVLVNKKPILYWIIRWLKQYNINHLVLAVGFKKEKIAAYMKQNNNFGLDVNFSEDKIKEGGTAHAFKNAINNFVVDKNFIGMNSDELTNVDLSRLISKHEKYKPLVTMEIAPFHCRFGVVKLQDHSKITNFEYGERLWSVPVSMGVYAFNRAVVEIIPRKGSIEDKFFTTLAKQKSGKIRADMLKTEETWVSINTQKDIKEAEAFLKSTYTK